MRRPTSLAGWIGWVLGAVFAAGLGTGLLLAVWLEPWTRDEEEPTMIDDGLAVAYP